MKRARGAVVTLVLAVVLVWWGMHPYGTPDICYGVTLHPVNYPYHPIPCGYTPVEP